MFGRNAALYAFRASTKGKISAHRNLKQQVATVLRLIKRTSRAIFNLQSQLELGFCPPHI
jgi:hypothetical protein